MSHRGPFLTKPGPGVQVDWTHPLSRDLLAWWTFAEGNGSKTFDRVLHRPATLTNGPVWMGTPRGGGLSFDGSNDYAVSTGAVWTPTGPFTLSVMCYLRTAPGSGTYEALAVTDTYAAGDNFGIWATNPPSTWYFQRIGTGGSNSGTAGAIVVNTWMHLVLVGDRISPFVRFYENGVQTATATAGNSVLTSRNLVIGSYSTFVAGTSADALIDDVRVWNRPLSASEVSMLFAQPYVNLLAPRRVMTAAAAAFNPSWAQIGNMGLGFDTAGL